MRRPIFWIAIAIVFLVAAALVGVRFAWQVIVDQSIVGHQRSVTNELARWGDEYSVIRDRNDVSRAIGMLEYIQNYYVVAPGYRSDDETESRLEEQRRISTQRIVAALEQFTGESYGTDVESWKRRSSTGEASAE